MTRAAAALAAAALALVSLGVFAGCAPGLSTPSPAATPTGAHLPDGVTVELRQSRADVAGRQAAVRVINGSRETISIGAVSVDDPRFEEPAARIVDRTSSVAPGVSVDVRVQLADVACDVAPDSAATATLAFVVAGVAGSAVLPIDDPVPFVEALHVRECLHERVLQAAAIDLGAFSPSPSGEPGALELAIEPHAEPDVAVRLVGIRETNLLTFAGLGEAGIFDLDLDLATAGTAPITVTLPLRPARCDPHAVLEDKRGTVFRLLVDIDGDEGSFDLAASEELRGQLLEWVAAWCGFGEG